MDIIRARSRSDRWTWFAAGDASVAPPARPMAAGFAPREALFEIGLVLAVPLLLATAFGVLFGT